MAESSDPTVEPTADTGEPGGNGPIIALAVAVLALAAVLAFVFLGGNDEEPDATTTTAGPTTTSEGSSPTTSVPGTSQTTASTPTTVPATTVTTETTPTTAPAEVSLVPVFFLHDSGGRADRPGPFLMAASRNAADLEEAISQTLAGLTPSEEEGGLTSAIPPGTSLNGVSVSDGVATVDLSSEFQEGGGTLSMQARLAQLVFTVTASDPDLSGVRLALDGEAVEVFSGEGLVLDDPMTRDSFQDVTPGILIEWPAFDAWSAAPVTVTGIAAAFEGVFQMEILDSSGNVVADVPFVQTDNGLGWGRFSVTFDEADLPPMPADLQIRVWEFSAEDGSVINERIQPFGYRAEP